MSASLEARDDATRAGGPSQASSRTPALTGVRAVAALLVVGTHAAFATGYLTHGFVGVVYARLEVGVAIFFVLSGFLLFRPWVRATAGGAPSPSVPRYARRRVRRVVPAYVVTVIATFEIYTVFTPGPNPGQSWHGLLRHLTFTQVYTADSRTTILHPGLTQMWSMAVEVAFYAVLPVLAYLLLQVLCRGEWRPRRILAGLGGLALVSPVWIFLVHGADVLPNSATMWLPAHLTWFLGGMALAVLQTHGARCSAKIAIPLTLTLYLLVATPIGGALLGPEQVWQPVVKSMLYAAVGTLAVAPLALDSPSWYSRVLASRPMVWLGEISYEIFLLHVVIMALVMHLVLRWPLFTGSMPGLMVATLALTIPAAWGLNRVTRPQRESATSAGNRAASARPRCDTASFSSGLSSAAVLADPTGRNTGS